MVTCHVLKLMQVQKNNNYYYYYLSNKEMNKTSCAPVCVIFTEVSGQPRY